MPGAPVDSGPEANIFGYNPVMRNNIQPGMIYIPADGTPNYVYDETSPDPTLNKGKYVMLTNLQITGKLYVGFNYNITDSSFRNINDFHLCLPIATALDNPAFGGTIIIPVQEWGVKRIHIVSVGSAARTVVCIISRPIASGQ